MNFYEKENISLYLDNLKRLESMVTLKQKIDLPISFCDCPQTALVLGGGSLFAAYELLKYPSILAITLCDHDYTVLISSS